MIKRLSVVIVLGIALSLSACGNTDKVVNKPTEAEKVTEAIESTPEVTEEPETATEKAEEIPVIYADDEEINLYLNRYNEANVGQEITSDQFEPYKHHGSVHKSQIKLKTEETTISATGTKVTVYLEYKDLEQYKEAFLRFAKPFSDTDIEKCWEQVLADDTRVIEFDGFSTETSKFNGNIEYMSIYGSIEEDYMKIGVRKPSLKKAIKASTTGKAKRAVKKAVNPLYGKKGVGLAKNPKRVVKNAVYKKTTVGLKDLLK